MENINLETIIELTEKYPDKDLNKLISILNIEKEIKKEISRFIGTPLNMESLLHVKYCVNSKLYEAITNGNYKTKDDIFVELKNINGTIDVKFTQNGEYVSLYDVL